MCLRLLEDGSTRLLEDGFDRLLESGSCLYSVTLSGLAITTEQGSLSPSADLTPSGQSITPALGTLSHGGLEVTLSGQTSPVRPGSLLVTEPNNDTPSPSSGHYYAPKRGHVTVY